MVKDYTSMVDDTLKQFEDLLNKASDLDKLTLSSWNAQPEEKPESSRLRLVESGHDGNSDSESPPKQQRTRGVAPSRNTAAGSSAMSKATGKK